MKRYFLHWNGLVYAMTIYGDNKRDAINRYKTQNYMARMPSGYTIWEG